MELYGRSGKDYSMKTRKFSEEDDFNEERVQRPETLKGCFFFCRGQERVRVDAAALWQHGVHPDFFPHHYAGILPPATPNAAAGGVPYSPAAAAAAAAGSTQICADYLGALLNVEQSPPLRIPSSCHHSGKLKTLQFIVEPCPVYLHFSSASVPQPMNSIILHGTSFETKTGTVEVRRRLLQILMR